MTKVRYDALFVGGGVIGLSSAWELARRGLRVAVVERAEFGREASWAGAGIVAPAPPADAPTAFGRLRAASAARWPAWSAELAAAAGVDIGFRNCGGLHLLAPAELPHFLKLAASEQILAEACRTADIETAVHAPGWAAAFVPSVCQVRSPRFLRALFAALPLRGASVLAQTPIVALEPTIGGWLARTNEGRSIAARHAVVCAGAWSAALLAPLGIVAPVRPVLGQLLAVKASPGLLRRVVEVGRKYLVPREDGVVLIGATEEDAGYGKPVTAEAAAALRAFAAGIVPALAAAPEIASWTGLRPATPHGRPWLYSPLPGLWVAAGHFRQGLQLAPGTAALLADWLTDTPTFARPADFAPNAPPEPMPSAFVS